MAIITQDTFHNVTTEKAFHSESPFKSQPNGHWIRQTKSSNSLLYLYFSITDTSAMVLTFTLTSLIPHTPPAQGVMVLVGTFAMLHWPSGGVGAPVIMFQVNCSVKTSRPHVQKERHRQSLNSLQIL